MPSAHPRIHTGCSGFSYKEWKGLFYPKGLSPSKWFEYYCTRFDTVELNVTFYRTPALSTLQGWYKRSPADFRFVAKAPKVVTHYMQFRKTAVQQYDFSHLVEQGLEDKLAAILYQLPASIVFSQEALDRILENMTPGITNVVEFRHASWWKEEVYQALAGAGVIFCSCSYPGLPDMVIPGPQTVYYRFHGVPKLYYSSYDEAFLQRIVEQIGHHKALLYFNNTAEGHAIQNAVRMKELAD